jgi:glyceraldehyde 3-phosphate dehydrogenase
VTVRVGINGFGRIGRNFWRAVQAGAGSGVEIVAANDLGDLATFAHLLKYDTVLGTLVLEVAAGDGVITAGPHTIRMLAERDPARLGRPGRGRGGQSTGRFTKAADARSTWRPGAEGHHLRQQPATRTSRS